VLFGTEAIDYPRVTEADLLVALSQPAYDKYRDEISPGGVVVVDEDLVEAQGVQALPFTKTAEKVGHKIVTNIVMLGYLGAFLDLIPYGVLEETVLLNVPKGTEELNRRALEAGRRLYLQRRG
jgi:2-oxoglutarate ferredoxin oxidoreductase subunit gamma